MEQIIAFLKEAIAALLALFGVKYDADEADKFVDNVESGVKDVVDFGKDAAAK